MDKAPDLLQLVTDWWKQSKWSKSFDLRDNKFVCKCCSIIWMRVESDRVFWGLFSKKDERYVRHEIMAADKRLFDQMGEVFEKANHDPAK